MNLAWWKFLEKTGDPSNQKNCKIIVPFSVCWDFECLNARVEESLEESKTQNVYHQWPIARGYYTITELPEVLKPGYHEHFGLCNVELFVGETIKLEHEFKYDF